jgi:hypothetical protein
LTEIAQKSSFRRLCASLSPVKFYMRDADLIYTGNTGRKYWFRDEAAYRNLRWRLNRVLTVSLALVAFAALFMRVDAAMIVLCWIVIGTFIFEDAQVKPRGIRIHSRTDEFLTEVRRQLPYSVITPDFPQDRHGEAFFDIELDGATCTVSFRPDAGFGFFGPTHGFGERPVDIIKSVRHAVKEVRKRLNDAKP